MLVPCWARSVADSIRCHCHHKGNPQQRLLHSRPSLHAFVHGRTARSPDHSQGRGDGCEAQVTWPGPPDPCRTRAVCGCSAKEPSPLCRAALMSRTQSTALGAGGGEPRAAMGHGDGWCHRTESESWASADCSATLPDL
jgi:hypothetical protein